MPVWLTIFLALGGSVLISLIVNSIWRHGAAKINRIKELEKKAEDDARHEEEKKRQEDWEQKVLDLIHPLSMKLDAIQEELKLNKAATTTSLRTDLMLLRDRFRDQGYATRNDKAAWNQLYNDYKDLGGNHFREYVDQWKDEVNNLPTIPDVEHGKGRRNDDKKETE
jgi:hypothetical protein